MDSVALCAYMGLLILAGRCPFRQYMPSKPAKYGIKSWVACDAQSSYAWKMQVYTGKPQGGHPERNQGTRVVLDLTQGLSGRNITCDNFFTSYNLGQRLLRRGLTMVGTVRKNKPELPPALLATRERAVLSCRFASTCTTLAVSYLPKRSKNVVLLSTLHAAPEVSNRPDGKPSVILCYNANKGGVDNLDKVIGTYSCRRMTARWPMAVFHNMLDVSSYNAFVIWREVNPDWMPGKRNRRRVFLEELGKALVAPLIRRRKRAPRAEAAESRYMAAIWRRRPWRGPSPSPSPGGLQRGRGVGRVHPGRIVKHPRCAAGVRCMCVDAALSHTVLRSLSGSGFQPTSRDATTDGRTDGRTDGVVHRSHYILSRVRSLSTDGRTDGQTV
ncbi:hypothetical protein ABVT39_007812 [Epinephelus coioides]